MLVALYVNFVVLFFGTFDHWCKSKTRHLLLIFCIVKCTSWFLKSRIPLQASDEGQTISQQQNKKYLKKQHSTPFIWWLFSDTGCRAPGMQANLDLATLLYMYSGTYKASMIDKPFRSPEANATYMKYRWIKAWNLGVCSGAKTFLAHCPFCLFEALHTQVTCNKRG